MKFFLLLINLIVFTSSSLFAMKEGDDVPTKEYNVPIKPSDNKISSSYKNGKIYDTYLKCEKFEKSVEKTKAYGSLDVYESSTGKKIGNISLYYYPKGHEYNKTPYLKLRHIFIDENFRRKKHATRALEILFVKLRTSHKDNIQIKILDSLFETNEYVESLKTLFKKFGFVESTKKVEFRDVNNIIKIQSIHMNVDLLKTKFPHYHSTNLK